MTVGNADLSYAQPVDGTSSTAVPVGRVAKADPSHDGGFRVGGVWSRSDCSSISATFTRFSSTTTDAVSLPSAPAPTAWLRALLTHPNTPDVASDSLGASIDHEIHFANFDVISHRQFGRDDHSCWNARFGLRYSNLDQDTLARYTLSQQTAVRTEIDFDGFGPIIGLDAKRRLRRSFDLYGSGLASFVFGEFRGDYQQSVTATGQTVITGFDDDRIVPILEYEIGLGWTSDGGCLRVKAGYYLSSWFNAVTTPGFVRGVQSASFDDIDDTITFHGFTSGIEVNF